MLPGPVRALLRRRRLHHRRASPRPIGGTDVTFMLNLQTRTTEACTWQVSPGHGDDEHRLRPRPDLAEQAVPRRDPGPGRRRAARLGDPGAGGLELATLRRGVLRSHRLGAAGLLPRPRRGRWAARRPTCSSSCSPRRRPRSPPQPSRRTSRLPATARAGTDPPRGRATCAPPGRRAGPIHRGAGTGPGSRWRRSAGACTGRARRRSSGARSCPTGRRCTTGCCPTRTWTRPRRGPAGAIRRTSCMLCCPPIRSVAPTLLARTRSPSKAPALRTRFHPDPCDALMFRGTKNFVVDGVGSALPAASTAVTENAGART